MILASRTSIPGLGGLEGSIRLIGEGKYCDYMETQRECCSDGYIAFKAELQGRLEGRGTTPWRIPFTNIGIGWRGRGEAGGSVSGKGCIGSVSGEGSGFVALAGGLESKVSTIVRLGGEAAGRVNFTFEQTGSNGKSICFDVYAQVDVSIKAYATIDLGTWFGKKVEDQWSDSLHATGSKEKVGNVCLP